MSKFIPAREVMDEWLKDPKHKAACDALEEETGAMKHSEFTIGGLFWGSGNQWRCTDIGTRTIIGIRIDKVDVGSPDPDLRRTLNRTEAEAEGWFNGPPYAVLEHVFDENEIEGCTLTPDE